MVNIIKKFHIYKTITEEMSTIIPNKKILNYKYDWNMFE